MKHWIGLFAVFFVMTAAALILSHGIQRRHHEPQPALARPLDDWPTQADLDRLKSVKGKTRTETIKILGHPAEVTILDDGSGMDEKELLNFFSTLGAGARKIGGIHDNFGVGAKIAALPWNPEGLVVISYKHGKAAMIWIMLDEESGDYELTEFQTPAGKSHVIQPQRTQEDDIDWGAIKPDWITDHGTVIVLLGSEEYPDTILGNPQIGEAAIKGLSIYLNTWHDWRPPPSHHIRIIERVSVGDSTSE